MSRRTSRKRATPHPSVAGWAGAVKRTLDVTIAAVALVAASPLLLLIALLVGLTSKGPVLFRQRRIGLGGREFTMIKFRTMVADAEPDGRPVWATTYDPRCTFVGAVLRRFGLDEVPQLWNVIHGDMSLVGPRPERPEFARDFARRWPGYDDRHAVRGGLTGLAQVEGWRGDSPLGGRLECDWRYIAGWSLAADLVILARTVPEVLFQRRTRQRQGEAGPATLGVRDRIKAREAESRGM